MKLLATHRSPSPDSPSRSRRRGLSGIWVFLGGLLLIVLLGGGCAVSAYNGMVSGEENVDKQWAEIENQYKRRFDLIPQLVDTVKGASGFEQETITAVTEARASVGKIQLPDSVGDDPAQVEAFMKAQSGLSSALSRLLVVAENYPQLNSVANFRDLQSQLEGTENRIAVARRDYIDAIQAFNTTVRKFPNNLLAGTFGFEKLPQLEQEEENLSEAPKIDFGG